MSRDKQMVADLIEIFDEEYSKKRLITPHNTADKMTAKGYRKASDIAAEIFEQIDDFMIDSAILKMPAKSILSSKFAELKKKYTEGEG